MSFDAAASPEITLLYTRAERMERARPFGWGVAWYAASDRAATVVKDPTAAADGASTRLLRDWTRFRSTAFICHLRGAAARISQESTHPFARSHAGRDWVMTHHGQLRPEFKTALPLGDRPVFEPMGPTDTEHVLCWLLHRCREGGMSRLAEIGWERLRSWLGEVNQSGSLDLLISDGSHLVVYQDAGDHAPLYWTRRTPPHAVTVLANDDIEVDFGGVRDRSRTAVIVTTDPLAAPDPGPADEPVDPASVPQAPARALEWQQMLPGQMLVVSRGAVVWDSVHGAATAEQTGGAGEPGVVVASAAGGPVGPLDMPVATETGSALQQPHQAPEAGPSVPPTRAPMPTPDDTGVRVYDIFHATRYAYETPVEFSKHVLRLRPIEDRYQQLLSFDLAIDPLTAQHEHEDVFGNYASRIEIEGSAATMAFVARSRVQLHTAPAGELRSPHRRTSIPLSWMPWQRQMMLPYLLPMELPELQLQELFDYAMSFVERQDYDLVETLLDINSSIYRDYAYVQGVTSVETTPFEVYTSRRGVCQDFANLLICLARLLNVPARYRVGYIYTGANYENKLQSDASHAWVEVFFPWVGWKGLDPTNGCVVGGEHIRIACGRHYRDATPTSGTIYRGGGEEKLEIEVRVEPVPDAVL